MGLKQSKLCDNSKFCAQFVPIYLSVPLQVLPHSNCLLNQMVQILRQIGGQALGLQDPKDLVASDKAHLGHTMRIPQDHT